ncbi:MAG: thioesterase II family protein [Labedaea sp.]
MERVGRSGSWFRRFHPASRQAVRMVLFPHAGGSASYYLPLSEALSPYADVLTVQYPGRSDRFSEPCVDSVGALARGVADELRDWLDRPIVLFGHSLGASVAFEVARWLAADLAVPARELVVSGRHAPADVRDSGVHRRDDNGLLAQLSSMNGTDPRVLAEPELMEMFLPALRADYRAAETYVYSPGPPLGCPILALVGDSDDYVSPAQMRRWRDYTTGEFELAVLPGDHFYLAPQRSAVVSAIAGRLG